MDAARKTTILFPSDLHDRLTQLAERTGTSMGELVRRACEAQYGLVSEDERRQAVAELSELSLPVGSVAVMKRQSVPDPDDLLP